MDDNLTIKYLQSSPDSDSKMKTPIPSDLNFGSSDGRISEEQLLQPSSSLISNFSTNISASQETYVEAPSGKALTSASSGMGPPNCELFGIGTPSISSGVQNPCQIDTVNGECSDLKQPVTIQVPKKPKKRNRCGALKKRRKKAALRLKLAMSDPSLSSLLSTTNITSSQKKDSKDQKDSKDKKNSKDKMDSKNKKDSKDKKDRKKRVASKIPAKANNISSKLDASCSWVRQVLSYSNSSSSEDENTSKRPKLDESSLKINRHISKRPPDETLRDARKNLPQLSDDYLLQRMIVRLDQKSGSFSIDEALEFSDTVGDLVERLPSGSPIPRLVARCVGGQLIVTADDRSSLHWLVDSIDKIQPWKGIILIAKDVQPVRLRFTSIWIPGKRHQSTTDTLTALEKYNPGLSTKYWQVVERHEEDRGLNLFVKMDEASLKFLKGCGFRLHIKAAVAQITTLES